MAQKDPSDGPEIFVQDQAVGHDSMTVARIEKVGEDPLLAGLPGVWTAPVYHHDRVNNLPYGFTLIATSNYCRLQAMSHEELPIWSVQFHPEVHFGINEHFADPIIEWDDESAFESSPNKLLIENFIDICLST